MSKYVEREIVSSVFEDDGFLERVHEHVKVKMKRCPCCGKPARVQHIEYDNDDWLIIECPSCGLHSAKCETHEEAAELWNARIAARKKVGAMKTCPFCGGKAELVYCEDAPDFALVECRECGASSAAHVDPKAAIKLWNSEA